MVYIADMAQKPEMNRCPYSKLRKPKKSWSFSGIQNFE